MLGCVAKQMNHAQIAVRLGLSISVLGTIIVFRTDWPCPRGSANCREGADTAAKSLSLPSRFCEDRVVLGK
jgi:hypothetical protein